LNSIRNCLLANQLSLNVLKTEYLYCASDFNLANIGASNTDTVKIGGEPISRVQSTKSLGVMIDQRLGWDEHVDSLCTRVLSGLAALKQARRYVPQHTLKTIYKSLIEPLFDSCDVVWGNLNKTLTTRLQRLQNRTARIIARKGYGVRSSTIPEELRWDDLETTRRKHVAILMYKIVNKRAPSYLIDLFEKRNSVYSLRESGSRLILPKYNTAFAKGNSFDFVGGKMWNSIPFKIRSATSLSPLLNQ